MTFVSGDQVLHERNAPYNTIRTNTRMTTKGIAHPRASRLFPSSCIFVADESGGASSQEGQAKVLE